MLRALFISSLFASSSLANPLKALQARSVDPATCQVIYTACFSSDISSAATWCSSLGYGTSVVTVTTGATGTSTARRTIISTVTSFTATTTKAAPTSTSTNAVTKTTTLTSISTLKVTKTTSTVTINAAGTLDSCGVYTPTYLSVPSLSASSPSASQSTPTSTSSPSSTPTSAASTTSTPVTTSSASATVPPSSTSPTTGSTNTVCNLPKPSGLPGCIGGPCNNANPCPQDDGYSLVFQYDGPTRNDIYLPAFEVMCDSNLYERTVQTLDYVGADTLTTCLKRCILDLGCDCGGVTFLNSTSINGNLQQYQCYYRRLSNDPVESNTTLPQNLDPADPNNAALLVSALYAGQSFKRDVGGLLKKREALEDTEIERSLIQAMDLDKRQAAAKPSCVQATNAAATSDACGCVIPSPTTTRTTTQTLLASTVSSTRTVYTTLKAVSTVTTTPIKTITKTVSTSTSLLTRTTTTTIKTAASTTTTGTWGLASTPTAFYIVDSHNGVAMWPADADNIFYNVQYDDSPDSTDPPPTSFGLQGTELIINDFVDMDVVVVGQPYNGTGAQVMALERKNAAAPNYLKCAISARQDGTCPLSCTDAKSGGNSSWTDGQGLWYLLPQGQSGVTKFDTFVLQAPS